ncbi:MAG: alcohol dehydrogenase [Bacteroidia bacterium]|nr:MAG: alcohol dehydrogenase [Bacteroidia bacterium]
MMKKKVAIILFLTLVLAGYSQDPTAWRGPTRDGIYPETGLMKEWPANGPEVLWSFEELGKGHSSAIVDHGFIYATGMIDNQGNLFKFDLKGKLVFKKAYGPEYTSSYVGTRGTPTIVGEKVYLMSGNGKLYCLDGGKGSMLWSKDLLKDFDGKNIQWGMNESPVVDGEVVYITPGGKKYNLVALDRHTGKLIWSSPGKGELTAYCTPLLFEHNGRKMLATHTETQVVGFDALTGKMLWSQTHTNDFAVHPNTPIYHDGMLFYLSGYGSGGGMLKISDDGNSASRIWTHKKMDSRIGGAVLVDGYLYGSGDSRLWCCYDWKTGREMYTSKEIGNGVVIYADGMLYCYSMMGELALVKADPAGFKVVSKTKVLMGSEQHWAHPVIYDGVLYVRHGKALIAYKVK